MKRNWRLANGGKNTTQTTDLSQRVERGGWKRCSCICFLMGQLELVLFRTPVSKRTENEDKALKMTLHHLYLMKHRKWVWKVGKPSAVMIEWTFPLKTCLASLLSHFSLHSFWNRMKWGKWMNELKKKINKLWRSWSQLMKPDPDSPLSFKLSCPVKCIEWKCCTKSDLLTQVVAGLDRWGVCICVWVCVCMLCWELFTHLGCKIPDLFFNVLDMKYLCEQGHWGGGERKQALQEWNEQVLP